MTFYKNQNQFKYGKKLQERGGGPEIFQLSEEGVMNLYANYSGGII